MGSLLSACSHYKSGNTDGITRYYTAGLKDNQKTLKILFELLAKETESGEEQFSVVREIASEYIRLKEYGKLINFLNFRVDANPDDGYNAYYLLLIAYGYIQQDAHAVAALYFNRIIKNYPDLTIRGESVHLACLTQLINLVEDPEQQVWYYEELISRFPEKIDLGVAYFQLARSYERIGNWNRAIKTYTNFLPYNGTMVSGFADAYTYAKQIVDFYNSPRDWTFENLGSLITAIKNALDSGSSSRLWSYRAKVNFFARSWSQEAGDDSGMAEFSISQFMRDTRISYAAELDAASNANEAYLRTWGWSQGISTWYLYFKKIYFPLDPDIHGRWEWAGVYYGEKF
ncbi:MAG: tetratricopeptide repeat protein [Spirochaetaceae bacterium]|jgi:tetratricopeptide (TPR) repeat protein|nr:tetratricopeptide repeat protein [Spirochaetaceae bacterium]